MILQSPRAGQEAEIDNVFMNFTMATACTEPARELCADELDVGVELEVETDLSVGSFTVVLPTESEQVVAEDLVAPYVEVESCLDMPDQTLQTLPVQNSSVVLVTSMPSLPPFPETLPSEAMSIELVTSLPDQVEILGTLPLEPTSVEVATSLASQTECLETMSLEVPVTKDGHVDETLARAAIEAVQTGKMTSLIKEELRCSIQTKRLQDGKDELEVEPDSKKCKTEHLSPDDEERRRKRRDRNKLAAQKCRLKKRVRADELEMEIGNLEGKNESLQTDIEKLGKEKEKLVRMLRRHDTYPGCGRKLSEGDLEGSWSD